METIIVTQSYKDDYEECKLLCESIDKFVPEKYSHFVFVDDSDRELFNNLKNSRRYILPKSIVLPKWLFKLPLKIKGHNVWISPFTIPVRGWILQQVVKLGIFRYTCADCILNLDSEIVFIKPFREDLIIREGKLLLHRQTREWNYHRRGQYIKSAARILNIKNDDRLWKSWYMSSNFCFTRDNLVALAGKIEHGALFSSWELPLLNCIRFSEYMLYGLFVEHVIGIENSGHFASPDGFVSEQYPSLYDSSLEGLKKNLSDLTDNNKIAVLVQKSRGKNDPYKSVAINDYRKIIHEAWDKLNYE
jgi:hypothetical protein